MVKVVFTFQNARGWARLVDDVITHLFFDGLIDN